MSVHVVQGADEARLGAGLSAVVHELVGDGDRASMVAEFDGDDYELDAVVQAAQTPPFLTERRIVVARSFERFTTADAVAALVAYLAEPLDTTELVLVRSGGRLPASLTTALKQAGARTVDTDPPRAGRERAGWLDTQFRTAAVRLDADARDLVVRALGDDVGRLEGLLETLTASFGPGARLGVDDVTPLLGQAGTVPPWELTDAIDKGDTVLALELVGRLLGGGERHPLALMAILQGHYGRMLRLEGSEAADERSAAELLGIKGSTFPARKALDGARKLGRTGVGRAVLLLADADLDLRGRRDLPEELVVEILVARLCALAPRPRARPGASGRGRR